MKIIMAVMVNRDINANSETQPRMASFVLVIRIFSGNDHQSAVKWNVRFVANGRVDETYSLQVVYQPDA